MLEFISSVKIGFQQVVGDFPTSCWRFSNRFLEIFQQVFGGVRFGGEITFVWKEYCEMNSQKQQKKIDTARNMMLDRFKQSLKATDTAEFKVAVSSNLARKEEEAIRARLIAEQEARAPPPRGGFMGLFV